MPLCCYGKIQIGAIDGKLSAMSDLLHHVITLIFGLVVDLFRSRAALEDRTPSAQTADHRVASGQAKSDAISGCRQGADIASADVCF
jgi:hypothetical protein